MDRSDEFSKIHFTTSHQTMSQHNFFDMRNRQQSPKAIGLAGCLQLPATPNLIHHFLLAQSTITVKAYKQNQSIRGSA